MRTFYYRAELTTPAPIVLSPPTPQPVLHAWVEPPVEGPPVAIQPAMLPQQVPPQIPPDGTNWLFYLEVDHGVEDLAGITLENLNSPRTSGILTIDDLLSRPVPQIQETARMKGFLLSVDRLHALCGQAALTIRVPMLRRSHAAPLYASGIHSVEELSRLRPETVYDRVCEFQRSESGTCYRRSGRLIDRQQSINWRALVSLHVHWMQLGTIAQDFPRDQGSNRHQTWCIQDLQPEQYRRTLIIVAKSLRDVDSGQRVLKPSVVVVD